jgi:hypothetical protein
MDDFELFWMQYPRKVAKAHAAKMWRRLTDCEKFAATQALPVHVKFWRIAGTSIDKIPHAGTWLNPIDGRRWEDELAMPEAIGGNDWMKTTKGIEMMAAKVGITARAGESHLELKARILAKERVA